MATTVDTHIAYTYKCHDCGFRSAHHFYEEEAIRMAAKHEEICSQLDRSDRCHVAPRGDMCQG